MHGFDSSAARTHTERGPWQRPPGSAKGLFLFTPRCSADCSEHRQAAGAVAEGLMRGPQYNGACRSALGDRTMIETPILVVIAVLAIAAIVWWLFR